MFTIIIPTLERHDILLRAIDYYQHFNCNVLIVDSSDNRFIHKFPDNIIYKYLPKMGYGQKIYEAAKDITTPYVCTVADDDYIIESGLMTGVCFLDDNPDYASAQGRYYKFELIENRVTFSPRYGLDSCHYDVESNDTSSRIIRAFNPYMHHFYAIHRTELFTKSWKLASFFKNPFWENLPLPELTQILTPMCYGKHKILPMLWMVRDSYIFDHIRRQKYLADTNKNSCLIFHYYKQLTNVAKTVESFLNSKDSQLLKKLFREVISDVASDKESDRFFNAAFKSYGKWLISERNKIIFKLIIKLVIPNWILKNHKKRKQNQYSSVIEKKSFSDDFNKIRLSILNFQKCYDNYR
jgi:glycosyltransferase domain-containing protein